MPDNRKAIAVLAFIVTKSGRTLLRVGLSSIQPTSTRPLTRITIRLAAFGTTLRIWRRLEFDNGELFTFRIVGELKIHSTDGTYPYFIVRSGNLDFASSS
jgi:hypothetical protein